MDFRPLTSISGRKSFLSVQELLLSSVCVQLAGIFNTFFPFSVERHSGGKWKRGTKGPYGVT